MFQSGHQIGPYHLIRKLGRGGFGEVWLAERRAKFVTTKVAIKMPLDNTVDPETIKQEAVLWEQASGHPNVLPIIEADEYDGQIVIVSEYAPDGSLDDLLEEEKTLSIRKSVEMTIDILKGLDFLHSRQIIHRDIKPANILLQGDTPRLTDFGVSRIMKATSVSVNVGGTPSFMAPEAFDRKRTVQTDIWSVGVVLYRMLTGYLPFPEGSVTDLIGSVVKDEPQPFPDSVPGELQRIILKALAKRPDERYQSSRSMSNDLTNYLVSISKGDVEMTIKDHALLKTLPMDGVLATKEDLIIDDATDEDRVKTKVFEHTTAASGQVSLRSRINPRRIGLFGLLAILLAGSAYGGYILYKRYNSSQAEPSDVKKVRLIPFRKGDKWGFCDENKKLVIEAKYDNAQPFSEGLAVVSIGRKGRQGYEDYDSGKSGAIDQTGNEIVMVKYDGISSFKDGIAIVRVDIGKTIRKFGLIDMSGREIVPPQYDSISKFVDGFARVELNGKLGYIDKKGPVVIPLDYGAVSDSRDFSGGLAVVNKGGQQYLSDLRPYGGREIYRPAKGKYGYIDMTGKEIIPIKYDKAGSFPSDPMGPPLAAVTIDGKCGYIDQKGEFKIPAKWTNCEPFSEGLASVEIDKKWGFISGNGNEVIPLKYRLAGEFHEGLASVGIVMNGYATAAWGFINRNGEEVVPPKYFFNDAFLMDDSFPKFTKGLAHVCLTTSLSETAIRNQLPVQNQVNQSQKCGFIDKNGNEVIPLKYDQAVQFVGDLARVSLEGKEFYIDRNGVEYYEP